MSGFFIAWKKHDEKTLTYILLHLEKFQNDFFR
nr:MAG TPA: hypothetical protein [Caudoviricetes sp.]